MDHSEQIPSITSPNNGEISAKKVELTEQRLHGGAVEIMDHYAVKCDSRKLSDCSDPMQPTRPPRKSGDFAISSIPVSRKASSSLDSSPMKPSRKLSQSSAHREFAASSDNISMRTPKKVSFSDELPMTSANTTKPTQSDDSDDSDVSSPQSTDETIQLASQRLESMYRESQDSDRSSDNSIDIERSVSTTIATQTTNELTKADMFPNSRKVSLHSERSFDMGAIGMLKPGTETASTQITTDTENEPGTVLEQFIDSERRSSTTSVRSNSTFIYSSVSSKFDIGDSDSHPFRWLLFLVPSIHLSLFLIFSPRFWCFPLS